MKMFDKIFNNKENVSKKQENVAETPNINSEELLLFKNANASYDGNTALKRQKLINEIGYPTFKSVKNFSEQNKLADQEIINLLNIVKDFKQNHSFDIAQVNGEITPTRINLFPGTIKNRLLKMMANQKITEFDQKEIVNLLKNGKKDFEQVVDVTAKENENKKLQESEKQERIKNFEAQGNKSEMITTDGPMLIVETHNDSNVDILSNVNKVVPEDINKSLLKIKYHEGLNARKENEKPSDLSRHEITDSSGRIGEKYLSEIFKQNEKASIVLTGGHMRGCLSESLKNCLTGVMKSEVKEADIHVLLSECYDSSVYDGVGEKNSPVEMIKNLRSKTNVEIYLDEKIQDVYENDNQDVKKVKLFLWSQLEKFASTINDKVSLAKVRQSINKKPL